MRIAIFHDYFRVLGGAEKLVLTLAKHFNADIITAEFDSTCIKDDEFKDVKIIPLGKISKFPELLPGICMKRFRECDFSNQYDVFVFSGTFSIYAAKKHKPNLLYCHTPLRGLYDLNKKNLTKIKQNKTFYSKIVSFKKKDNSIMCWVYFR
jgi:hypothetical protein